MGTPLQQPGGKRENLENFIKTPFMCQTISYEVKLWENNKKGEKDFV